MRIIKESLNKLFKSNDSETTSHVENILLAKFSKRRYEKDINNGNIHLCALSHYRNGESKDGTVNDSLEGTYHSSNGVLDIFDEETKQPIIKNLKTTNFSYCYDLIDRCGICCFSRPKLILVERKESRIVFKFDQYYLVKMMNDFDSDVIYLLIEGSLRDALNKCDTSFYCGNVNYMDETIGIDADIPREYLLAFQKRTLYSYQREFRIITAKPIDKEMLDCAIEPFECLSIPLANIDRVEITITRDDTHLDFDFRIADYSFR